jgi:hypothetical protein
MRIENEEVREKTAFVVMWFPLIDEKIGYCNLFLYT